MRKRIKPKDWQWFGNAAHFICAKWCRFHMATRIGDVMVSTVGEYFHPRHAGGSELADAAWTEKAWPGEDIGAGRKFETIVFPVDSGECPCGCGLPDIVAGEQLDMDGYNDQKSAREGHIRLCHKWAGKGGRP